LEDIGRKKPDTIRENFFLKLKVSAQKRLKTWRSTGCGILEKYKIALCFFAK
jgi:hypothetical protein